MARQVAKVLLENGANQKVTDLPRTSPRIVCPPARTSPRIVCPPARTSPRIACPPARTSTHSVRPPFDAAVP